MAYCWDCRVREKSTSCTCLENVEDVAVRVFDREVAVAPELVLYLLDDIGPGLLDALVVAIDVRLAAVEVAEDADTPGGALLNLGCRDMLRVLGGAEHHHQVTGVGLSVHRLAIVPGQRLQPLLETEDLFIVVEAFCYVVNRQEGRYGGHVRYSF